MIREPDSALQGRIATLRSDMVTLEADLRRYGSGDVADVIKRARRELDLPAATEFNIRGVSHRDVRR